MGNRKKYSCHIEMSHFAKKSKPKVGRFEEKGK